MGEWVCVLYSGLGNVSVTPCGDFPDYWGDIADPAGESRVTQFHPGLQTSDEQSAGVSTS